MKEKDKSLFPLMLADLMMGAMAIVTVMLIFLAVVSVKGQGTVAKVSRVNLPPGLLDSNSKPYVRIRIMYCGAATPEYEVELQPDAGSMISKASDKDCRVRIYHFPEGLGSGGSRAVVAIKGGTTPDVFVRVSVGGWWSPEAFAIDSKTATKGETLATISLRDSSRVVRLP